MTFALVPSTFQKTVAFPWEPYKLFLLGLDTYSGAFLWVYQGIWKSDLEKGLLFFCNNDSELKGDLLYSEIDFHRVFLRSFYTVNHLDRNTGGARACDNQDTENKNVCLHKSRASVLGKLCIAQSLSRRERPWNHPSFDSSIAWYSAFAVHLYSFFV